MQKYVFALVSMALLGVASSHSARAEEDSGATVGEPLAVVLLPTRAHVREIGFKVRPSAEWSAMAGTAIDAAVREVVDQSNLLSVTELPSITPEERAAIDEFLAVATLVQIQSYGEGSRTATRNLRAYMDSSSGPVLAFLRDRAKVDYVLIPLGTQAEQGTEWVALSAAGAVASVFFPPTLVLPASTQSYTALILVDLRTGLVSWLNGRTGREYGGLNLTDLRDPESAHKVISKLLQPFPEIPSKFEEKVAPTLAEGGLVEKALSPPDHDFALRTPVGWRVKSDTRRSMVTATRNGGMLNEIKVELRWHSDAFPGTAKKTTRASTPAQLSEWYVAELQYQKLDDLQMIEMSLDEQLAGRPAFRAHFSYRLPPEMGGARIERVTIGTASRTGLLLADLSAPQFHYFSKVLPAFEEATQTIVLDP